MSTASTCRGTVDQILISIISCSEISFTYYFLLSLLLAALFISRSRSCLVLAIIADVGHDAIYPMLFSAFNLDIQYFNFLIYPGVVRVPDYIIPFLRRNVNDENISGL